MPAPRPEATRLRPTLVTQLPRDLPPLVDVLGAGRAVRAMLTVAALQADPLRFRIWCRHHSRAELLRIHLADLPPLAVEIVVSDEPPADGAGSVVLALGRRTSRRSRQRSKDALFSENLAIIEGMIPALKGRTVIVVTNPSTRLTARLASEGVDALGIGVFNDQLRFERDAPEALRLVGAHNPFELGFGVLGPPGADDLPAFPRPAYRDLTNRQDRQRPLLDPDGLLARLSPRLHEAAWRDLGAWHDGLDLARRWYARQRLASRYLENGIACGRAILMLAAFLTGRRIDRPDLTVEAPMRLPGGSAAVLGWPLDAVTGEPRALRFDAASLGVIKALGAAYAIGTPPVATAGELTIGAPGAPTMFCRGDGLEALCRDLVPLAAPMQSGAADIDIALGDDPAALVAQAGEEEGPVIEVAQHRGKNPFEHRDLTIRALPGRRRLVRFSASGGAAVIDDAGPSIALAVPPGPARRDEFRKLLRDQILTPAYTAAGAWALHAGLVAYRGAGLLLLGDSGAGKTTGALHLLCGSQDAGYGASERVLVMAREGRLHALGVPESLTIFRGSLRGLASFADLTEGRDLAEDWQRAHKLRLSRDDVVSRLGTHQIAEPIPVTHVALVRYAPGVEGAVVGALPAPEARRAALAANDLTTEDDVRAAWLGWFEARRDPAVPALLSDPALPFAVVDWSRPKALSEALARFALSPPEAI